MTLISVFYNHVLNSNEWHHLLVRFNQPCHLCPSETARWWWAVFPSYREQTRRSLTDGQKKNPAWDQARGRDLTCLSRQNSVRTFTRPLASQLVAIHTQSWSPPEGSGHSKLVPAAPSLGPPSEPAIHKTAIKWFGDDTYHLLMIQRSIRGFRGTFALFQHESSPGDQTANGGGD